MKQDTIENVSWPITFSKKISSLSLKKDFMQLFSADTTMFLIYFYFFSHENLKKPA